MKLCRRAACLGTAALFLMFPAFVGGSAVNIEPVSASDGGSEVAVWLTLPDQSKLLSREPNLAMEPRGSAAADYVITVDEGVTYQTIEGFGAAMTDSSAWLLMRVLSSGQREAVLRDLFTREGDGIGISYLRLPAGASDFALRDYTYNDLPSGETDLRLEQFSINYDEAYIIPALQAAQALNPQLRFMGSPWSAPAWMKTNERLQGGELQQAYYQAFADYLVRFIQAYAEHGIAIDTLTPQNEPLHVSDGYPTMRMAAADQARFVRDHLGPALRAANLATRLIIFDHNWDLWRYATEVLADPEAAAYVDGVAFHCYGGNVGNQSFVHDAHPDKGIWFTECSGGDWSPGFAGNLSWNLRNLGIGNIRNWGNSLLLWNLALDEQAGPQNGGCQDCRGVITVNSATGDVTYNVEYYVLGHFSKFVDRGAVRIESTAYAERQPENVAFRNPDGSLVLVVHATRAVTFTVVWQDQQFSYSLPEGAVASFHWPAPEQLG